MRFYVARTEILTTQNSVSHCSRFWRHST